MFLDLWYSGPVSATIANEMTSIGLHFGLIRAVETFANLREIDRTVVDQLFKKAFVSGLPPKVQNLVRALQETIEHGGFLDLNRFTKGYTDSLFDGPIEEGLLFYFTPSEPSISQAWSDEHHDFSGEMKVTIEDYAEEQRELRASLASLEARNSLQAFRPAATLGTIGGHAMITPSGVNAFFVVPSVNAAWVLSIHMLLQLNGKGEIRAHGKIRECPECANYIIDVAPRGRPPRVYCSKRCGTRRHQREKRKRDKYRGVI